MKSLNAGIEKGEYRVAIRPIVFLLFAIIVSGILFKKVVAPNTDNWVNWYLNYPAIEAHEPLMEDFNNSEYGFSELKNRMLWSMSVFFFAIAFLINGFLVYISLAKITCKREWLWGIFLSVGILSAAGIVFLPYGNNFTFNELLLKPLQKSEFINQIVSIVEFSGLAMLIILVVGCSVVLMSYFLEKKRLTSVIDEANLIGKYLGHVKIMLYGATLTLIAGTLHSSAIYSWALSMMEPCIIGENPQGASIYYYMENSEVSGSMGAINGIFYSVLMLIIFAPVFFELSRQSKQLAIKANPNQSRDEIQNWMNQRNLNYGFKEQILPIISTLGPALVGGPLLSILESI